MKNICTLIVLALVFCCKAFAQSYEVPHNYHFDTTEDYARYEADIIKTADWMQQAPWASDPKKMEAANQFVLIWAQGSQEVLIELKQPIMNLSDANPQLGFTYMAQFSKYALQHKANFDKIDANMAALRAVIAKYNMEPAHKKDKDVEKLMELDKAGKLADWINNQLIQ